MEDNIFKYPWILQFKIHGVSLTTNKIDEFYNIFGHYYTKNHTKEYLIDAWKWIIKNEE